MLQRTIPEHWRPLQGENYFTTQIDKMNVEINRKAEFNIADNWENSAKELRKKYSNLSEEDLKFEPGKENDLLNRIGIRLGKKRVEVISMIKNIQSNKK